MNSFNDFIYMMLVWKDCWILKTEGRIALNEKAIEKSATNIEKYNSTQREQSCHNQSGDWIH